MRYLHWFKHITLWNTMTKFGRPNLVIKLRLSSFDIVFFQLVSNVIDDDIKCLTMAEEVPLRCN